MLANDTRALHSITTGQCRSAPQNESSGPFSVPEVVNQVPDSKPCPLLYSKILACLYLGIDSFGESLFL